MAHVPHTRASALPGGAVPSLPPSPLRLLAGLAAQRPDDVALLLGAESAPERRSWAEVHQTVLRAGAGLLRSGLRADQVVLSLLPTAHLHPELDVALRGIGAVVVHVSADATPDEVAERLAGAAVRLVVSCAESDLDGLVGLDLTRAEMFPTGDGGWERLLALGAERLVMDPEALTRADRSVDPDSAVPRLLGHDALLARRAAYGPPVLGLPDHGTTLVVGDRTDPLVDLALDAHLAAGGTLVHAAATGPLGDLLAAVRPDALVLSEVAADTALAELVAGAPVPAPRRRRAARARTAVVTAVDVRAHLGGNLSLVVAARVGDDVAGFLAAHGARVSVPDVGGLVDPDLPVPPPVVIGDAADLPRRSRGAPGRDFQLETDRPRVVGEAKGADESAFVLPSLPLFGGESFLDKLLLARADAADA